MRGTRGEETTKIVAVSGSGNLTQIGILGGFDESILGGWFAGIGDSVGFDCWARARARAGGAEWRGESVRCAGIAHVLESGGGDWSGLRSNGGGRQEAQRGVRHPQRFD